MTEKRNTSLIIDEALWNDAKNNGFKWIDFYTKFATALLPYKKNRAELIEKIQRVFDNVKINFPKLDSDGKVTDVDPFTVYGLFNRGYKDVKRCLIIEGMANEFEIDAIIPDKLDGIPRLPSNNAVFYPFKDSGKRGEHDIDHLWDVFESALSLAGNDTVENRQEFSKWYEVVIGQDHTGWNITMGLYWFRPYFFLTLDQNSRLFISNTENVPEELAALAKEKGLDNLKNTPPVLNADDYLKIQDVCKKILESGKQMYKTIPELSYLSWYTFKEGKRKTKETLENALSEEYLNATGDQLDVNINSAIIDESRVADYTLEDLGNILSNMYEHAKTGTKVTAIHIFGIKYGKIITENSYKVKDIITASGLKESYYREVQKGIDIYKCLKNNTFGIAFTETEVKNRSKAVLETAERVKGGKNILLYGVPGAGKSYAIKHMVKDPSKMERVVFHPDYTYSDFVGQILPKLIDDPDSDEKKLSYEFVAGPFTRILEKALLDPYNMYYLVIEEINRGNAPAIFGEVFQLLDRLADGRGEYSISSYDVAKWVYEDKNHDVRIPSNLSVLATMNTSDQNVFTLDTAFQRRWEMELIPNNVKKADHSEQVIEGSEITWGIFASIINGKVLSEIEDMVSSEDKRLGAYFIKGEELEKKSFSQKVLKYLWDDAFKFNREVVFNEEIKSLEQLLEDYEKAQGDPLKEVIVDGLYKQMLSEVKGNEAENISTSGAEEA